MTKENTDALTIRDLILDYGASRAVNDVNLALRPLELGCLLGPSGCGKSTLLRAIAGFHPLTSGEIWLDGNLLTNPSVSVSAERRGVGMMFQDIALFPHLTVEQNIGFGLSDWPESKAKARIRELLDLISLHNLGTRYPHELSGGQQQRVALARSMAPRPKVLLLDEPFSGLDTELRGRLTSEVRTILKGDGICSLLVTHDRREAFDFADRIAVMDDGHICQFDTPFNLYHEPISPFVAHFVGPGEMVDAKVYDLRSVKTPFGVLKSDTDLGFEIGSDVRIFLRPDDLIQDDDSDHTATLVEKHFRGAHYLYEVRLENGVLLGCFALSQHDHKIGERFGVSLDIQHLVVFPK